MNHETIIQRQILLALSGAGCTVFRNETGQYWAGVVAHKAGGQVTLRAARPIPCGLCVGSSDIIGWTSDGRFLAVEVKTEKGRATKEQLNFIDRVKNSGGVAFIARSATEALEMLANATKS